MLSLNKSFTSSYQHVVYNLWCSHRTTSLQGMLSGWPTSKCLLLSTISEAVNWCDYMLYESMHKTNHFLKICDPFWLIIISCIKTTLQEYLDCKWRLLELCNKRSQYSSFMFGTCIYMKIILSIYTGNKKRALFH